MKSARKGRRAAPGGAMRPRIRSGSSRAPRINEEPNRDLTLGIEDEAGVRAGDRAHSRQRTEEEFPPARVREAGRTGAELADANVTADDASPSTLLDSERSHTPRSTRYRQPLDTQLEVRQIPGEHQSPVPTARAADAGEPPVGRKESEALRRKVREHARDINAVEPHEVNELADAARERRRRRRSGR